MHTHTTTAIHRGQRLTLEGMPRIGEMESEREKGIRALTFMEKGKENDDAVCSQTGIRCFMRAKNVGQSVDPKLLILFCGAAGTAASAREGNDFFLLAGKSRRKMR